VKNAKNLPPWAAAVGLILAMGIAKEGLRGACTALAMAPAAETAAADFVVSPKGDDRWSGRVADPGEKDGPFATIARASGAVRALLKAQKEPRTARVVLRGETYYLDQPLEFGPEDSGAENAPVVYAAAAGERVVLSAGRRITGGRWGEANGRKAWIVDIPEVKEGKWNFRQLFVKGQRGRAPGSRSKGSTASNPSRTSTRKPIPGTRTSGDWFSPGRISGRGVTSVTWS
jgi:hypothetical protein